MRTDFDSVWKETLETYFVSFLETAVPELAPMVGHDEGPVFLDQELQELAHALGDERSVVAADEAEGEVADEVADDAEGEGEDAVAHDAADDAAYDAADDANDEANDEAAAAACADLTGPETKDRLSRRGADLSEVGPGSSPPGRRRRVDKLVRVPVARGMESHVPDTGRPTTGPKPTHWLVHVEVQVQRNADLPGRLFDYHSLIVRRHRCWVVTIALLADLSPSWRPGPFASDKHPRGIHFGFSSLKLIDLEPDLESPRFTGHPFAMVARAHLATLRLRHAPERLYAERWRLTRRLYEEGFAQQDVLTLYRLIDRLMILPAPLMLRFRQELFALEKAKNMPYVDTISRMCREEGLIEGLQTGRQEGLQTGLMTGRQEGRQEGALIRAREAVIEALEVRFGEIPFGLREQIIALDDLADLKSRLRRAIMVPTLEQF